MKLLLVLLATMTWTVVDKNTVHLSDDSTVPYDINVSYSNTYNAGHVRAGDVATLSLSNLNGITIESVSLAMRSNKNAGAGQISVMADNTSLANMSVTWQSVSNAVQVFSGQKNNVNALTITVSGTQNSLYVDAFTITYASRPAYTVTLMNGSRVYATLTEEAGMQGVLLPCMPDTAQWQFIGWSGIEFWETPDYLYALYPAGERFYMNSDRTLWATYRFNNIPEEVYATELESGIYQYVNRAVEIALTGVPEDGRMDFNSIQHNDPNQYYDITFTAENTAFITHHATQTPIGYSGTDMAAIASPWQVYHDGEETLFYTTVNQKNYVLWLNIMSGDGYDFYAGLLQANPGPSPMALLLPVPKTDPIITCHPESPQDIENAPSAPSAGERILMHFGNYDLIIIDGQKYLRKK